MPKLSSFLPIKASKLVHCNSLLQSKIASFLNKKDFHLKKIYHHYVAKQRPGEISENMLHMVWTTTYLHLSSGYIWLEHQICRWGCFYLHNQIGKLPLLILLVLEHFSIHYAVSMWSTNIEIHLHIVGQVNR